MSGGGGDGGGQFSTNPWSSAPGSSGVSGGVAGQEACEALVFRARLRNVDSDELVHVAVGDILKVEYRTDPTPTVAVFRYVPSGAVSTVQLGALAERLGELLPCLQLLEFEAEVLDIDGGNTKVEVRPA